MGLACPFLWVAAMAVIIAALIAVKFAAADQTSRCTAGQIGLYHLLHTIAKKDYRIGFSATALLSIGGFMMMPFAALLPLIICVSPSSSYPYYL